MTLTFNTALGAVLAYTSAILFPVNTYNQKQISITDSTGLGKNLSHHRESDWM